ncbi:MAG TPA: ChbG/HpnK family deacetylase [Steroidobacteraceae bacterium]
MRESKSLVVCADDFGIHASVSNAIVRLIDARRISATSILVLGEDSERSAPYLAERRAACSVGLHFSLTEASGWRTWVPLPVLLASASLRLLSPGAVRERITRQLDRFEELFGTPPDFLDGHEHVHQFPSIREIVLDRVCERYGTAVAVRSTQSAVARGAKAALLGALGGKVLTRTAGERGLTVNADFAGAYSFERVGQYRARIQGWLETLGSGGLLMCHPGSDPQADSISMARFEEYSYLRSREWPEDLATHEVSLVPFRGTAPAGSPRSAVQAAASLASR